ncbi:uncharacterized protein LOC129605278 isoform X2 [Condylostylus longicornis]|uniref:uncharacterized protein LOC129605278 isoform X2 n=1 Tax=Condylostylus longicornis TaxID=2530218 RepID=UPI00244E2A05|nr:uncharacterized protein LOC129605278 isoform X2 [Condylostylus longicornis]
MVLELIELRNSSDFINELIYGDVDDIDDSNDSNIFDEINLQLAAELGKTLLERNKELETKVRYLEGVIDDKVQENEHLQKQNNALREVNDARLHCYETLDISIQDLERKNEKLNKENIKLQNKNKAITEAHELLERERDESLKNIEDLKKSLHSERKRIEKLLEEKNNKSDENQVNLRPNVFTSSSEYNDDEADGFNPNTTQPENCSFAFQSPGHHDKNSTDISDRVNNELLESLSLSHITSDENEEIIRELDSTKKAYRAEQQKVLELEDQIFTLIRENQSLQGKLAQSNVNEDLKSLQSVQDELSILDEVRQGRMCTRCLRSVDERTNMDEASSIAPTEDDDDRSLLDLEQERIYHSALTVKLSSSQKGSSIDLHADCDSPNPYRELLEKYEALVEIQSRGVFRKNFNNLTENDQQPSLSDELQSCGFICPNIIPIVPVTTSASDNENYIDENQLQQNAILNDAASCNGSTTNETLSQGRTSSNGGILNENSKIGKSRSTPTEIFSEAETSSSGFSDETSNKSTQTDDRPGYFLCSIGDGEDCKFSIYDDVSPVDSRFRNRPEYRELFKEIFAVLRKAAKNKEEGEKLPLLDDTNPSTKQLDVNASTETDKVPPVTPSNEELPDFGDDTQSVVSSVMSEQSVAMSECITKTERKSAKKHIINQEVKSSCSSYNKQQIITENGLILTPLKREPLEYVAVGVGIKKKNRKKNRNFNSDRSESPVGLPSPPRIYFSGKKRRDMRPLNVSPLATHSGPERNNQNMYAEWNGTSMVIYNRNHAQSPTPHCNKNNIITSNTDSKEQNIIEEEVDQQQQQQKQQQHHHHHHHTNQHKPLDMTRGQYRPSQASQDLHKLKKLELSYAEVLRRADACKHNHNQHPNPHHSPNFHHNHHQNHQNHHNYHHRRK